MRAVWRTALRLAVAHHPLCSRFRADVVHPRFPVCAGCAAMWPLFTLSFFLSLGAILRMGMGPWTAVLLGVVLGLPQFATYVVRTPRPMRFLIKTSGGVGLGLAVAGGLLLPWARGWKVLAACLVLLAFTGMQALRMRSMLRRCRNCTWRMAWDQCPGFHPAPENPPEGWTAPSISWRARDGPEEPS